MIKIRNTKREEDIRICEKQNLTIKEAVVYSGIGETTLRGLLKQKNCPFVLLVGKKQLIKRKAFDDYIDKIKYL